MDALAVQLAQLENAQLVRRLEEEEPAYIFKHVLTQEAAYETLLLKRRREIHRFVAETIERFYSGRLDEQASLLAGHYAESGDQRKAYQFFVEAAQDAKFKYANAEAISLFKAALSQVDSLRAAELEEKWERAAAQVGEDLGDLFGLTGQVQDEKIAFETALKHVPTHDRIWRARLERKISMRESAAMDYEERFRALERIEGMLGEKPEGAEPQWWQEWLSIQFARMGLHYWLHQWREEKELAERVRPFVEKYGSLGLRINFLDTMWGIALNRDRFLPTDETMALAQSGLAAALESRDESEIARERFRLGFTRLHRAELEAAQENIGEALSTAERIGDAGLQATCLAYLTLNFRRAGRVEEAKRYIPRSLKAAQTAQMPQYTALTRANTAWVAWREGRFAESEAEAQAALAQWNQPPELAVTYAILFWAAQWPLLGVAWVMGRTSDAINCARELLAPTQQPFPPTLQSCLEHAVMFWDERKADLAQTELEDAINLARTSGYL